MSPSVLFVCVKNGGKSQMAAALMRQASGESVEVHSGGTHPGTVLNAESVAVLAEVGAQTAGEYPKPIDRDLLRRVDRVIIVGSEAVIESIDGMTGTITTWETVEPSVDGVTGLERMRLIRDAIALLVPGLIVELSVDELSVDEPAVEIAPN